MVVRCEVLTVEIEHVDVATLETLEQQGIDCQPRASTIRIIQVCLSSCVRLVLKAISILSAKVTYQF